MAQYSSVQKTAHPRPKDSFRAGQLKLLRERYGALDIAGLASQHGTPLYLIDKAGIESQYRHLRTIMPLVEPHFAIKACPMPEILAIFKSLHAHLDVASDGEIALLKALDYPANKLIYTHPHKTESSMQNAYEYGIRTFVIDDDTEISIIEPYKDDINVLIRLGFENEHAHINLSRKFGMDPGQALDTTRKLLQLGINVIGITFHVGSQMDQPDPYRQALLETAALYEKVHDVLGHSFSVLDIGGGLPAAYTEEVPPLQAFADVINPILATKFSGVTSISEPGRFLVNPFVALVSRVVSKTQRADEQWLFIDDGVYGSFSDMLSGHMQYVIFAEKELHGTVAANHSYVVAGPTCDSIDVMSDAMMLPETQRGDLLIVPNMGAYSYALASQFNSIPKTNAIVI